MKPFRINLSSRYRAYLAPVRLVLMVLAGVLMIAIAWDLHYVYTLRDDAARLGPSLARIKKRDQGFVQRARREGIDLSDPALDRLSRDVGFANQLIGERTFSWTALLTELERTVPNGMAINGVQHHLGKDVTIRLTGSALGLQAIQQFTEALAGHAAFYDPALVQHRVRERTGLVDFSLRVGYRSRPL